MYKNHFQIEKVDFQPRSKDWGPLWWREVPKDFNTFHEYLVRVGHRWGWDKMNDRFSAVAMAPKLAHPETRLRELVDGDRVVGYTLILTPAAELKKKFWNSTAHVIEIENIGLFPEECGKGMGGPFLDMQLVDLFNRYDIVYLSSSSTNHPHVPAFYKRMGMTLIAQEPVKEILEPQLGVA